MPSLISSWKIIVIAALVYLLVIGATQNAFSLFVMPVSAEFGLSRASFNTAYILISIGSAIMAPFIGAMLDRYPLRPIMVLSVLSLGTGFIILGLSHSLWLNVFALAFLIPAGVDGTALISMGVLVGRWFKRQLGRAMALSAIGMSLGGVLMPPLVALLIEAFGWRMTLICMGCGLSTILLLLTLSIRERPGPDEVESGVNVSSQTAATSHVATSPQPARIADLLRMRKFWSIALSVSLVMGISTTNMISLAPLGMGTGLTMMQATSLLSMGAATAVIGKLLLAWFADSIDSEVLLYCMFALGIPLNGALIFADDYASLLTCAALLGITTGAMPPTLQTVLVQRFGIESFGRARGLLAVFLAIFAALSMRFAGEVFDRTDTYSPMFITFIVAQIVAIVALFAGRNRVKSGDIAACLGSF